MNASSWAAWDIEHGTHRGDVVGQGQAPVAVDGSTLPAVDVMANSSHRMPLWMSR